MSAPRFHLDRELAAGASIPLPDELAHHALRALRLRDGDSVIIFNGRGGEYAARLHIAAGQAAARLERFSAVERESPLRSILVQAWVATDKLDLIIEKAVELGAASILLVPAARSVVQLDAARRERRMQRLRAIVVAACSQCGRNRLPAIDAAASLRSGLELALQDGARGLLLDPFEGESLAEVTADAAPVAFAVGPEGGFDDAEHALARRLGYRPLRLGPRILRTETAGLAALAALQALHGDLR